MKDFRLGGGILGVLSGISGRLEGFKEYRRNFRWARDIQGIKVGISGRLEGFKEYCEGFHVG